MSWLLLLPYLGACAAAATTGALFRPGSWYARLDKPAWTPPNRLFPIAWTILYLAIALAAWRVAQSDHALMAAGLALWAWQIALNTLWSPVFFGLRRLRAGLVVLSLLWLVSLGTMSTFFVVDAAAGWLFVPYVVWISYATSLNAAVLQRNSGERPLMPSEVDT